MTETTSAGRPRRHGVRKVTDLTPFQANLKRKATEAAREPTKQRLAALAAAGQLLQAAHRAQFGDGEMPPLPGSVVEQEQPAAVPEIEQQPEEYSAVVEQEQPAASSRRGRAAA